VCVFRPVEPKARLPGGIGRPAACLFYLYYVQMNPTRAGVDALLHVVARRPSQLAAHCIKCEPVHVLSTYISHGRCCFRVRREEKLRKRKRPSPPGLLVGAAFIPQSARERTQFASKNRLIGRLLQDLLSKVSFKALELIWKQYRLALADWIANRKTGDAFATCTKAFTTQWGLPCKHFIRWLLQGGEEQGSIPKALSLADDIDKHWWLSRDGSDGLSATQRAEYGI